MKMTVVDPLCTLLVQISFAPSLTLDNCEPEIDVCPHVYYK